MFMLILAANVSIIVRLSHKLSVLLTWVSWHDVHLYAICR